MPKVKLDTIDIIYVSDLQIDNVWRDLSIQIFNNHGEVSANNKFVYEDIFSDLFSELEIIFANFLSSIKPVSFFLFVNMLHEDSIKVWIKQLNGLDLKENTIIFSMYRKALKLILERSVVEDLELANSFYEEAMDSEDQYVSNIEFLLSILYNVFKIVDFHSRFRLFPDSIELEVKDNIVNIEPNDFYKGVYDYIIKDIPTHDKKVVGHNIVKELYQNFSLDGIDFTLFSKAASYYVGEKSEMFKLVKYDEFHQILEDQLETSADRITALLNGLIISKSNVLPFKKLLYSSQDLNRILYRPLLKYVINDEIYLMSGYGKWSESVTSLTTNCLPFGFIPDEWNIFPKANLFINKVKNNHEDIILDAARELFVSRKSIYEINIKSIFCKNKCQFSLIKKNIGQIDAIFLDLVKSIIYVCEFKHNRSRPDFAGWNRDYLTFKGEYEKKLQNKFKWVLTNKDDLLYHFARKHPQLRNSFTNFKVEALFIINAPTIYMYNSIFKTLTLKMFEDLLDHKLEPYQFELESEISKNIVIDIPYFDSIRNIQRLLDHGITL